MFRLKRSINLPYTVQGYVYFCARLYKKLGENNAEKVDRICSEVGASKREAAGLRDFVTSDASAGWICSHYPISHSGLYRMVKVFYEEFWRECRGG